MSKNSNVLWEVWLASIKPCVPDEKILISAKQFLES